MNVIRAGCSPFNQTRSPIIKSSANELSKLPKYELSSNQIYINGINYLIMIKFVTTNDNNEMFFKVKATWSRPQPTNNKAYNSRLSAKQIKIASRACDWQNMCSTWRSLWLKVITFDLKKEKEKMLMRLPKMAPFETMAGNDDICESPWTGDPNLLFNKKYSNIECSEWWWWLQ